MKKYIWIAVLAIPPFIALEFGAPKWVLTILFAVFAFYVSTIDPKYQNSEDKAMSPFVIVFIIAGLVMGVVLWKWAGALAR
jgi:hypothetical protein